MGELSKKYQNAFKNEIQYWIDRLGLYDWEISVAFEPTTVNSLESCVRLNVDARNARIMLNTEWPSADLDESKIRLAAFHEMCEIILSPIADGSDDGDVHTVIHRLCNVFWWPDWDRRRGGGK